MSPATGRRSYRPLVVSAGALLLAALVSLAPAPGPARATSDVASRAVSFAPRILPYPMIARCAFAQVRRSGTARHVTL